MRGQGKTALAVIIFMLFWAMETYSQCAMCKAAAESDLEHNPDSIAHGLNKGILFLMAIPYIVVGIIFRNEIRQFFHNIRFKEKNPINKKRLSNLTFALTFISCAVLLFIMFISIYKV